MFTGIIQQVGRVSAVAVSPTGKAIELLAPDGAFRASPGDSIAVNGCCLTLVELTNDGGMRFDVIPQTLRMTTLGLLGVGDPVNLEPAATPSTLLSGHIVQGHVDGLASASRIDTDSSEVRVRVEPPGSLMAYIPAQGSVTVDGVSLTVAGLGENWFEVAIIPATLELTNLRRIGKQPVSVNVEVDCLVKAMAHYLTRSGFLKGARR